ncbi:hypothetical protein [Natrinema salsiterrestre]|uniref:Uncharacterized protein n=1 Tax=Natrinema salsiterrestre TaxID=2950540 RepID=A0A9Q4PZF2_9EURY|nr:hypothetical protein [Natrinema salsiterrestre]MDF9744104.1 hypothetical protein [Natrinema salsiterrestre]
MQTNVRSWLAEMWEHFRDNPARAPLYVVYTWYLMAWFGITSRRPIGTNVYEREWDVLIVLDACRVDTLREVADEYDFIDTVDEMWSIGSHSAEWLAQTFSETYRSEIERTQYITGNPHTDRVLDQRMTPPMNNTTAIDFSRWDFVDTEAFESLEMVWEDRLDETYRVTLPGVMTDHAIAAGRTRDPERLIVHYMQPHLPYIGRAFRDGRGPTDVEMDGYEKLESGESDRETVYELYTETLRLVLDEVEVLLKNIDAERVAITADHGEAFGEMRAYGHPEGFPHPIVKKVPWVETSARDTQTRDPDLEANRGVSVDIEDHLQDLGYR